jgi:SAM-dependent methyltransferase
MASLGLRHDCDLASLPEHLRARFVKLEHDADAAAYLDQAGSRRRGRARTLLQRTLSWYMSDFDANGLLDMYPMYLLGTAQWQRLLGGRPGGRLLDVGAGSGDVTVRLAPLFDQVVTTELSAAMGFRLRRRGFACHALDVALDGVPAGPYDAISCLNVIDRTPRPRRLLEQLRAGLVAGGALVLAVPLPYSPMYYDGAVTRDPQDPLAITGDGFEACVSSLVERVLAPLGFTVTAFGRAPYLSGGDSQQAMYELDDAVVVCR